MAWINAGDFLGKFKSIRPPKKFTVEEAAEAGKRASGIPVKPEELEERGGTRIIKARSPAAKSVIFTNKEKIMEELGKRLGKRIKELRF